MAASSRINLNRLFSSSSSSSSSSNTTSKMRVIDFTAVRSEYTDRVVNVATQQLRPEQPRVMEITHVGWEHTGRVMKPKENQDQEAVKKQEKDEEEEEEGGEEEDDDDSDGGEYVNKETGEIGGPIGPEPTRFGDWERNGRCSDF